MRLKSKIFIISAVVSTSILTGCAGNQPNIAQRGKIIATSKIKKQKEQKPEYIYSSKNIEYADVKSIEKLKKATVILIDKVQKFEKELNNKKVKMADLNNLHTKLNISDKEYIDKLLRDLRQNIGDNNRQIAEIKLNMKQKNKYSIVKTPKINSVYDKKIMEFINKEGAK